MIHIIKYSLKQLLHQKQELFWILMFPIVLGLLFKLAFSDLGNAESFSSIPVAVVSENDTNSKIFREIIDTTKNGDKYLLDASYCTMDEAMKLLEENEISGILTVGDEIKLSVSANSGSDNVAQSILSSFVSQYNVSQSIIKDIAINNPEKLEIVVADITKDINANKEVCFSSQTSDVYTQYFYNLLAMMCLFTSLSGLNIATNNQGNFSTLGARKNIAPTNKLKLIVGELISSIIFNYGLNMIGFAYIVLLLKIDLTVRLPYAILSMFVSCMTGISLGFFVGALPTNKRRTKEAITISITMIGCFLSGLMVGNMRIVVETYCPIVNRINPAALISDSFYSLANYENAGRYYTDTITLTLLTIAFTIGGFLLTRRKKYASL